MDKHIEDIHFLEIIIEEDDEDGEDDIVYDTVPAELQNLVLQQ